MSKAVLIHAGESLLFTLAAAGAGWAISYAPHMESLGPQYLVILPVLTAILRAGQKWLEGRAA